MSYSVRDDNSVLGSQASIEFNNGAGAPTVVKIPSFHNVTFNAQTASQLVASNNYTIFIAPPVISGGKPPVGAQWQIIGAQHFYATAAGSAATYDIEVCPSGTANGSGRVAVNDAALNTSLSNAPASLTLDTNVDNLVVNPGDRINIIVGGTATTSLVGYNLSIVLARVA